MVLLLCTFFFSLFVCRHFYFRRFKDFLRSLRSHGMLVSLPDRVCLTLDASAKKPYVVILKNNLGTKNQSSRSYSKPFRYFINIC